MIPRRDFRPAAKEDMIVFAGRLAANKGVPLLMDAWDRYLAGARPPAGAGLRLVIAGTGPLDGEVAAWAATRPSVEVAGMLPGPGCAALMARARAVVVPSVWEEPFGLVVVEAMAAGTPVIAARHGAFTELVTPGTDGDLYPPADAGGLAAAIAAVASAPEKYEVYGKQARATYEQKFNPERSLARLVEIYEFAIANPAAGAAPAARPAGAAGNAAGPER
jgi:glycosyltransferase involved in cell wall biosynthesis